MLKIATILFSVWVAVVLADFPPPDPATSIVFIGFRHGHRSPTALPLGDDGSWLPDGLGELSSIGKKQANTMGKILRERYGNIVGDHFDPAKHPCKTSSEHRCQMTLVSLLAGLFPPKGFQVWDENVDWQPFAYEVANEFMNANASYPLCPQAFKYYMAAFNGELPASKQWLDESRPLVDYALSQMKFEAGSSEIYRMQAIADYTMTKYLMNLTLPDWIKNNPFKQDLFENVTYFAEAFNTVCALTEECRKMISGRMLSEVSDVLDKLKGGGNVSQKMYFYSGHSEDISSALWIMGVPNHNFFYQYAYILEYRPTPAPAVRLLLSIPLRDDPKQRNQTMLKMSFCSDQEWCPVDTFQAGIKPYYFKQTDWDKECKKDTCFCLPAEKKAPAGSPAAAALI